MHDDDCPSTPQTEWTAIADLARGHLDRLVKNPDLKPVEVKYLIEASRLGLLLDAEARGFDKTVELWLSRHGFCH